MAKRQLPSQEEIRQLLNYDPDTGKLFWVPRDGHKGFNTRWAGKEAFTTIERGYKQGRLMGRLFYAHRIIWMHVHGEWPEDIDHINGDRSDNRMQNLRNVSRSENLKNRCLSKNNSSGFHGVKKTYWGSWQAYIHHNGKSVCLGSFQDKREAVAARKRAEARIGYHKNHGRPNNVTS